jgi:hypothetical protein
MVRSSLNILKDARFDTSCKKQKGACLLATSLVSWPRRNNAEMFLSVQTIASSVLGVLGLVSAPLASTQVSLFLSKSVSDLSLKWAMEFVVAHSKSEFVISHGAVKSAL